MSGVDTLKFDKIGLYASLEGEPQPRRKTS